MLVRETAILRTTKNTWSSYKERKGNALAPGAEEGRSKLRKAVGNRKRVLIHRCPNGAIRPESYPVTAA